MFDEEEWLKKFETLIENSIEKKLSITRLIIGDPLITPIEKEFIQELIEFLSTIYPEQNLHLCFNNTRELTREERKNILKEAKANFTLAPIQGNIYIEEISKVHLFHEKWKLIIGINLTSTEERVKPINKTIELTKLACNKSCTPQFEIQLIELRYNRLVAKENITKKLLGKQRVKRGLANFVGDTSKTLFGTLSNSDFTDINNEFDKIYKDNKAVAIILSNHTIILKRVLDSSLGPL